MQGGRKNFIFIIQEIGNQLTKALDNLNDLCDQDYYSFQIDCGKLDDYNDKDIRRSNEYSDIFQKLEKMEGPVLYWFEIISDTDRELIRQKVTAYSKSSGSKVTPAMKKTFDQNSNTLYVGKVKGVFWGRMIQHLGFYNKSNAQGLQLFYWAKEINLKLKVNAISFDKSMADLVSVLELEVARRFQPIIGKHR